MIYTLEKNLNEILIRRMKIESVPIVTPNICVVLCDMLPLCPWS